MENRLDTDDCCCWGCVLLLLGLVKVIAGIAVCWGCELPKLLKRELVCGAEDCAEVVAAPKMFVVGFDVPNIEDMSISSWAEGAYLKKTRIELSTVHADILCAGRNASDLFRYLATRPILRVSMRNLPKQYGRKHLKLGET